MFLHDSASSGDHRRQFERCQRAGLELLWNFTAGGPIATSISIVGTTAYVGAWDGYEYAVNTSNGSMLWKTYLGITRDPNCVPATLGIRSSAGSSVVWSTSVGADRPGTRWTSQLGTSCRVSQPGTTLQHYNWSSPLIYNGDALIGIASNCDNPLVQGQLLEVQPDLTPDHRHL
jgi:outer membrane protein assembly factor BamB